MIKIFKILFFLQLAVSSMISAEINQESQRNVAVSFNEKKNEKVIKGDAVSADYVTKTIIGSGCPDENIYFKVGNQIFAAKQDEIDLNKSQLKEAKISINKITNEYEYTIRGDLGCKNLPAPFLILAIKNGNTPLILLVEDLVGYQPVLNYVKFLNNNNSCQSMPQPLLVACVGSKTVRGEKIGLAFLMPVSSENSWYTEQSEMPIHARCEVDSQSNSNCTVDEYVKNNVKISAPFSRREIYKDEIFEVRNNMLNIFKKLAID